jgi:murein L,D-transpeptidase YafK
MDSLFAEEAPQKSKGASLYADKILVEKAARRLTLFSKKTALKSYPISLGSSPEGPKIAAGDGKTPEGAYRIDGRNSKSQFYLALHLSYPNKEDRARARRLGVNPGGDIMIHGMKNGLGWLGRLQRLSDWTAGCIAVTNEEMEEIWRLVKEGTLVEIRP